MELTERDFFRQPFSEQELRELLDERPPAEVFAWRSPSFKVLRLAPDGLSDDALVHLMLQEPRLIRRPLLLVGKRLIIGADKKALDEALN